MKKLLLVLIGALVVFATLATATTVNVASDGTVWIEKPKQVVSKAEVTFDDGVLELGDAWKQAFAKKDTIVPVKTSFVYQRIGLFHLSKKSIVDVGVIYDGERVRIVRDVVSETNTSFTGFFIFWLISIIFMSLGVHRLERIWGDNGKILLGLACFCSLIAVGWAYSLVTLLTTFFGIVVVVMSISERWRQAPYYTSIVLYYMLMTIGLVSFLME